jgi:4-hydroxybenzoate polyprenyltransferase
MTKIIDSFFLLRPMLFLPVLTFFLAGFQGSIWFAKGQGLGIFNTIFPLCLVIGSVYVLNQIQDRDTDKINNKLFFLSEGYISVNHALIQAVVLAAAGMIWGFITDIRLGMLLAAQLLLGGLLYNYPPARWKDRPAAGLLTNAFCGVLIYFTGWTAGSTAIHPVYALPYFFAGAAVYLNTTLPDVKGDRASGKRTFAVAYGIKTIAFWAFLFEVCVLAAALLLRDRLILISALTALPFFVAAYFKKTEAAVIRATKFSILILVIAVCVLFPFLLLVIAALVALTKIYYKKRFDFDYPNFKG